MTHHTPPGSPILSLKRGGTPKADETNKKTKLNERLPLTTINPNVGISPAPASSASTSVGEPVAPQLHDKIIEGKKHLHRLHGMMLAQIDSDKSSTEQVMAATERTSDALTKLTILHHKLTGALTTEDPDIQQPEPIRKKPKAGTLFAYWQKKEYGTSRDRKTL